MSFSAMTGNIRSRVGKKQVVAFLSPAQAQAARDKAYAENKTVQEILGEAINAVFAHHEMDAPFRPGHGRIVRRVKGTAAVRTRVGNPACRSGCISVGGWFAQGEVDELTRLAARLGASNQAFVQFGMRLITGVEPDDDGWKIAAGIEKSAASDGVRLRGRPKSEGVSPRRTKNDEATETIKVAIAAARREKKLLKMQSMAA